MEVLGYFFVFVCLFLFGQLQTCVIVPYKDTVRHLLLVLFWEGSNGHVSLFSKNHHRIGKLQKLH